jgi:hypothetical protein
MRCIASGFSLALVLVACSLRGERLVGPAVYVQNDSGRAILLRLRTTTWAVGINEIATLKPPLPMSFIGTKWTYEIVDAESCTSNGAVLVDFSSLSDPYIVVPATGAATALEGGHGRPVSIAPDQRFSESEAAPDPCSIQPSQGAPASEPATP